MQANIKDGLEKTEGLASSDEPRINMSPVDTSLDAALELEELIQGKRNDAPAFVKLVEALRKEKPIDSGKTTISMLTDIRSSGMLRDAMQPLNTTKEKDRPSARQPVESRLELFLGAIDSRSISLLKEAKQFCLAYNKELLAEGFDELLSRQRHSRALRPTHGR